MFGKIGEKIGDYISRKSGDKSIPTLNVCMMGPRSVGKTTVLTSIFHESQSKISADSTIYMKALDENTRLLNDYYLQLVDAVDKKDASNLPASNTVSEFTFGLGLAGRAESVILKVRDFPGEYLTSEISDYRNEIYNFMSSATVILVAIDTPYLMEENGKYNEQKNKVALVTHYLKDNVDIVRDKLVLFVPLKCERYMHEGKIESVSEKTRLAYSDLIDFFKTNNIASFVTPIITLGGIEFDRMEDNPIPVGDIQKLAVYRSWDTNPKYKPLFCPQPLYYLLSYVTNYYEWQNKQQTGLNKVLKSFFSLIKNDEKFYDEMRKLSRFVIYDKNGFRQFTTNSILKIN